MIAILDYGAGNLRSVQNTLAEIGANTRWCAMPTGCGSATKIILPGVGHFGQMMRALDELQVREALLERIRAGVPFLGICLGMQALFERSEEAPEVRGLGHFPGTVRRFPADARVPHMGWNELERAAGLAAAARIWRRSPYVYFAHSYYVPENRRDRGDLHLHAAVHGGARIRQHLRRAVPSREIRAARAADREEFPGAVMLAKRIIPCLDVTGGRVVKGVNFVNLRDAGDPVELADRYNREGADELVFLDITASSDAREIMADVVARTARKVFIPLAVGGGIRSVADARSILLSGADKVSVNTAAVRRPELITRTEPGIRRAGRGAGDRCAAARAPAAGTSTRAAAATTKASTPWNGPRAAKRSARAKFC